MKRKRNSSAGKTLFINRNIRTNSKKACGLNDSQEPYCDQSKKLAEDRANFLRNLKVPTGLKELSQTVIQLVILNGKATYSQVANQLIQALRDSKHDQGSGAALDQDADCEEEVDSDDQNDSWDQNDTLLNSPSINDVDMFGGPAILS